MAITATYRDGTTKTVTSGYSAPSTALTTVPSQSVTVSYGGQATTLTFNVTGEAGLKIKTKPSQLEYYIGDKLNTKGLTLSYTGTDGKTKDITSGFTATADLTEAGSRKVTVS